GASLPRDASGAPFPSQTVHDILPLSAAGLWDVRVALPGGGPLSIWAVYASPPAFDGPVPFNAQRNDAQIALWVAYLDGAALPDDQGRTALRADAPFVLAGDLNADPVRGDSPGTALRALLAHPMLTDPLAGHPTVNWPDTGPLRV